MKIISYSDLHLEFGTNLQPPADTDADVMILAGDIITFKDFMPLDRFLRGWEKPVLYVTGNHEYYTHRPMREAYENKQLSGQKLMAARRLFETRRRYGKELYGPKKYRAQVRNDEVTAREILKAYKREVERKRLLARKADVVNTRLLFLVEAMRCLMQEDHFTTLLRAEELETMPKQLAGLLAAKGG